MLRSQLSDLDNEVIDSTDTGWGGSSNWVALVLLIPWAINKWTISSLCELPRFLGGQCKPVGYGLAYEPVGADVMNIFLRWRCTPKMRDPLFLENIHTHFFVRF